jgi:hypothetical protein
MWRAMLSAAFNAPMDAGQEEAYNCATDRTTQPANLRELWMIIGRRGGKDAVGAFIALYLACSRNWKREFKSGETVVGMIICPDRKQGRVALNYMADYAQNIPEFSRVFSHALKESIHFTNGIHIEIHTASFRSVRGYTVPFCILDEIAFFRSDDAASPDTEIIAALKPAMVTVTKPLLMAITTPYARRGEVWRMYRDHYGKESDSVLVVQGPTQAFNPDVPEYVIQEAFDDDPVVAASEYGSLDNGIAFRADVETYVSLEAANACVARGTFEIPSIEGVKYFGFVDPSGGSSDSFTAAVAHREKDGSAVLDAVREKRPPFSPEGVVAEYAETLKAYKIATVHGDRYAGEWPREQFRKQGIAYQTCDKAKSELYLELLPLINSSRARLLDDKRLRAQLVGLERRTSRAGRDTIDHPPGGHDDLVNAAAGALVMTQGNVRMRPPGDCGFN